MKRVITRLACLARAKSSVLFHTFNRPRCPRKVDCGPVTNTGNDLPRTIAIASNLPGTGAHALASGLAAVASRATPISAKVQPYNGPNAWMPLLDSGEIEFGIINILDAYMAATGTGNYKKTPSDYSHRDRRCVSFHRQSHGARQSRD